MWKPKGLPTGGNKSSTSLTLMMPILGLRTMRDQLEDEATPYFQAGDNIKVFFLPFSNKTRPLFTYKYFIP